MRPASLRVRRILAALLTLMIRALYRIDLRAGTLPERGPALIAANHTAYVDPFVLLACSEPPLRFVYWHGLDRIPLVGWFCRFSGGIPIASAHEKPELLDRAMREIDDALARGEVVAIFPEGALTRDGELAPFKRGIEHIIAARPTRVFPVAIEGLWGSVFSRASRRRPRTLRPRITLAAGSPIAPDLLESGALHDEVLRLRACAAA